MNTPCPGNTRTQRFRALTRDYEVAPHYGDDAFVGQYAKQHQAELLKAKSDILHEDHLFKQDPYFLSYLKAVAPHLLQWATWRTRALQIAERLDVGELPPSPPHRRRSVEEVRSSMVQRERTKIGDETAMAYVALELIDELKDLEKSKIKEIVERDDLTEQEKEERIEGVRAMTQQRFRMLMEGTRDVQNQHPADTPPSAIILGEA